MTPLEQAMHVYETEACPRTFTEDLALHLRNGYVFSLPEVFVMGRPVNREAQARDIVHPAFTFAHCDCWHVYLIAGDWLKAIPFIPYPLPWFSWERDNVLRFYPATKLLAKARRFR